MYQSPHRTLYRSVPPPKIRRHMSRMGLIVIGCAVIIGGALLWFFLFHHKDSPAPKTTKTAAGATATPSETSSQPQQPAGFDKTAHPTTGAASLWVIANKQHPLTPKEYVPANLAVPAVPLRAAITNNEKYVRSDTAKALEAMIRAAAVEGIHLNLQSGYRSYGLQVTLYNGYVKQQGQTAADRQSARPGYSEHQTGLAADLGGTTQPGCNITQCFGNTVEGKWLAANAHAYGFIIRYTADKEAITGYDFEPWHVRYVGSELSNEMHSRGVETLEEFFGVSGGTAY